MTDKEQDLQQHKEKAKEMFALTKELREYSILLVEGTFKGKHNKSWDKCYKYLHKQFEDTMKQIEENEWYSREKAIMSGVDIDAILKNTDVQYDPNYKISMEDVFREVSKKEKAQEAKK
jgi:hypothetical protein